MAKVWDWVNTNKLTLNAKKSKFVIFRLFQRKIDYPIFDNNTQISTTLSVRIIFNILEFC